MTDTTESTATATATATAPESVVLDPVATLTYTAVADPHYVDEAQTLINATVTFDVLGELPFTCSASDTEIHAAELYAALLAGTYGTITAYAAPIYTTDELEATARAWRDAEITASQWLVERHRDQTDAGTATTLTGDQYAALLVYRQALRDWPTVTDFPADSTKPIAPDWLAAAEAATDDESTATDTASSTSEETTETDEDASTTS
jgi:hypothetical protein